VESEISLHPDVSEVAVVARPHEKWGERPMAFVVIKEVSKARCKADPLGLEKSIKLHVRKSLAGLAVPEWIEFVEDLPKSR
jgi:acyl-coenzyme A synthetase/AMP-(fatty) acid ligase